MKNREDEHDDVFGKSFALYTKSAIEEFIEPLKIRFETNKLDAKKLFSGKRCLDAGCGNGRGSIFMLQNEAKHVTCIDISDINIASTTKNINEFGFENKFTTKLSSLENIPYNTGEFDFVWCNGVVMHTANPDSCLSELGRVLKTNGNMWLYIYGSGGIYWYVIYKIRNILKDISAKECLSSLRLINYPVRYVAEYMDDWKVPYLRTYTHADLGRRLVELGFAPSQPLPHGVGYDTSQRRNKFPNEIDLFGEGDLRYLVEKNSGASAGTHELSDGEYGSEYTYPVHAFGRVPERIEAVAELVKSRPLHGIAACAHIQFFLRGLMSEDGPFQLDRFEDHLAEVTHLLQNAV